MIIKFSSKKTSQHKSLDCSKYREVNKGAKYLFCCIDMFSKYAWAWPLTSTFGTEMASAMAAILDNMEELPLMAPIDKETSICVARFLHLLKGHHLMQAATKRCKCLAPRSRMGGHSGQQADYKRYAKLPAYITATRSFLVPHILTWGPQLRKRILHVPSELPYKSW